LNNFLAAQNNNQQAMIRRLQRQVRLARSRITVQNRLIVQLGNDVDALREGWIPRRRLIPREPEPESEVSDTESEVLVDDDDLVDL
jgi:hypothetical protein